MYKPRYELCARSVRDTERTRSASKRAKHVVASEKHIAVCKKCIVTCQKSHVECWNRMEKSTHQVNISFVHAKGNFVTNVQKCTDENEIH